MRSHAASTATPTTPEETPLARTSRGLATVLLLCGAAALSACIGDIGAGDEDNLLGPAGSGEPSGGSSSGGGVTPSGIQISATSQLPRLTKVQWENTVKDLFELPEVTGLSSSFAPDALGGKAFENNQSALDVTPQLWSDYQVAAEAVSALVTADAGLMAKLPGAGDGTKFIEEFGARAFRRPLSGDEVTALKAVFDKGAELYPDQDAFTAGVRLAIEAFLQSPHFVYRAELATTDAGDGLVELSSYEMASRLSYALWNSMPDPTLFDAAESGELDTQAGLEEQVDRLLGSERAKETLTVFFDQLYEAEQYDNLSKAPTKYPDWDPSLGAQMRMELSKFVSHIVFEENGGAREVLTSTTTFVTPELAAIYGIPESEMGTPDADGFSEVKLDPAERAGLLTRLGFLAWKGTETQPDTILRGVFMTRKIICQHLGDPPDEASGAMLGDETTNREKVDALTGQGTCGASCHGTYINPAGFALEHYGAIGEWRAQDNGENIDSSATFPFEDGDKSYADAVEWSQVLADSPQVHRCYSGFWVEYLMGRSKDDKRDEVLVEKLAEVSKDGSTLDVVRTLLVSDAIRFRLAAQEGQ
jgi:hypothetical protein